ncbi:hypothetical protein MOX02_37940 [Methylobacterium oxalidis]|uniref:Uncharacterized protein n=1 Tax=Methylobacterium oxalidis TaxID=944322 RepID=A0A512J709_9HYPH|nr:hypothetical protein MOX02_37940 [Methylobacterium oxalidis]GLS62661.1 hypothetical protein GCM10007888_10420 [Methylobacterium oxalidis]
MQGEAARRRESLGALVEETALDEGVCDELAQVLGRPPLHAGGDLFGAEFEEEVGHGSTGGIGRAQGIGEAGLV